MSDINEGDPMTRAHRIEHANSGDLLYISLDPDGVWARSEFPHPLITVDFDEHNQVIGIAAVGSRVMVILDAYREWYVQGAKDPTTLIAGLRLTPKD